MFRKKIHILGFSLIFLVIVSLVSCDNPGINQPTLPQKNSIKSKTKFSLDINTFQKLHKVYCETFSQEGFVLSYEEFNITGNLIVLQEYNYIDNIRIDSIFKIDESGKMELNTITKIIYNDKGNISSKIECDKLGTETTSTTFEYDIKGNVEKKVITNISTGSQKIIKYDVKYNDLGQLVERNEFANGDLINSQSYNYDKSNKSDFSITDSNINGQQETVEYTVNNAGFVISEFYYNSKKELFKAFKYEYIYY